MFLRGRPINLYAPTAEIATYDITKVATAPSSRLKLNWVYPLHDYIQYFIYRPWIANYMRM